jgi:hypothetical protein
VSLRALALVVAHMAASLTAEAQAVGKVPRVAPVGSTSSVQDLRDPERRGPVLRAFVERA